MNVETYRQHAADCVRQAQAEDTPEDKNLVLNVALAWLRLARLTQTLNIDDSPSLQPDDGNDADPTPQADTRDEATAVPAAS